MPLNPETQVGGLITYLLLAIYCHEKHQEPVSIKRVRELRIKIQNEIRNPDNGSEAQIFKERNEYQEYAKT